MREYTPKERRDKIEIEKGNYACASCGRTKHPLIDHPFCAQVCSKCTVGGTPHPHLTQADIMARNDVIDYLPEPSKLSMKYLFARANSPAAMNAAATSCGAPAACSGNEKKPERLIR